MWVPGLFREVETSLEPCYLIKWGLLWRMPPARWWRITLARRYKGRPDTFRTDLVSLLKETMLVSKVEFCLKVVVLLVILRTYWVMCYVWKQLIYKYLAEYKIVSLFSIDLFNLICFKHTVTIYTEKIRYQKFLSISSFLERNSGIVYFPCLSVKYNELFRYNNKIASRKFMHIVLRISYNFPLHL